MPRKIYRFGDFSGGLNLDKSKYMISENELHELYDAVIGDSGAIELSGNFTITTAPSTRAVTNPVVGGGIFLSRSDYTPEAVSGNDSTELTFLSDGRYVDVHSSHENVWYENEITLGDQDDVSPDFYSINGTVRVCDGEFSNTNNVPHWYGHVKRRHFSPATPDGGYNYAAFYDKTAAIDPPTVGFAGTIGDDATGGDGEILECTGFFTDFDATSLLLQEVYNDDHSETVSITGRNDDDSVETSALSGAETWTGDEFRLYPEAGIGFNIAVTTAADSDSGWIAGTYEFASTFIYDGNQESLPFLMSGTVAVATGYRMGSRIRATNPFNSRISGGRIYTRIEDGGENWVLLVDIDTVFGARGSLSASYNGWLDESGASIANVYSTDSIVSLVPNVETYEMLSGLDPGEISIEAKWKTSCVINRCVYIGNVWQDGKQYADRMIKSPEGKFDTFPMSNYVDVAIGDGDEIVKLISFGDRILQFKRNSLYVINVSGDYEFIESIYKHRGVESKECVCKTPYGIIFLNQYGCFMYDGNSLVDVGGKINNYMITNFYSTTNKTVIGYDAYNDSLIVLSRASNGGSMFQMRLDIKKNQWSISVSATPGGDKSSLVTKSDGHVMYWYDTDGKFYQWDNDPVASSAYWVKTKMTDLGIVGRLKRIYAINILYSCDASTNADVYIYKDDGSATSIYSGDPLPTTSSKITKISIPVTLDNVTSIQCAIKADGAVDKDFKVYAIEVEYRPLGIGYGN